MNWCINWWLTRGQSGRKSGTQIGTQTVVAYRHNLLIYIASSCRRFDSVPGHH